MLVAASCVIVLWSPNSIKSQWVRSEASAGMERGILLPVLVEPTPIPVAFRLVQTENLTDWKGDRATEAWRRLVLQIKAMDEASPLAGVGQPTAAAFPLLPADGGPALRTGGVGRWFTLLALAIALSVWYWGSQSTSTAFAIIIGVAAVLLVLFRTAEKDISPRMRALATRWLLPRDGGVPVNTAEALNRIFESASASVT